MLEREILQETGSALRKTEDKVNWALLQLEVQGREIIRTECTAKRREAIVRYNRLREEALVARRDLTIHREAAGIRIKNWERMEVLYPVPPPCPLDANRAPTIESLSRTCEQALKSYVRDYKLLK
mmetsp:Transcript_12926/g.35837  ORF Transcript_12926/g.35837 Transcript_12926/m.35837 type:complete len:125 (+) Transcript_12926:204-578(+)